MSSSEEALCSHSDIAEFIGARYTGKMFRIS